MWSPLPCATATRSIATALDELQAQGVSKLLVLPLYPQYSASTAGSTFDALAADFTRRRWLPDLRFVAHYHDFPPYIEAMARHIEAHWANHGRKEKLVLSYHGVPFRYLLQGDPYHCECHKTSRLLADRLGLSDEDYITTFQSRFGREEWLQPYTDETMKALPGQGVRSVDVFCPASPPTAWKPLKRSTRKTAATFWTPAVKASATSRR